MTVRIIVCPASLTACGNFPRPNVAIKRSPLSLAEGWLHHRTALRVYDGNHENELRCSLPGQKKEQVRSGVG